MHDNDEDDCEFVLIKISSRQHSRSRVLAHTLANDPTPLILLIRSSPLFLLGRSTKSCQIRAIPTILLLNALALDLASVAVGTIVRSGADIVGGVVLLLVDPVEDAMDDGVDIVVKGGELEELEEDLEPLDLVVMLTVDGCMPPILVALEFVPVLEEML